MQAHPRTENNTGDRDGCPCAWQPSAALPRPHYLLPLPTATQPAMAAARSRAFWNSCPWANPCWKGVPHTCTTCVRLALATPAASRRPLGTSATRVRLPAQGAMPDSTPEHAGVPCRSKATAPAARAAAAATARTHEPARWEGNESRTHAHTHTHTHKAISLRGYLLHKSIKKRGWWARGGPAKRPRRLKHQGRLRWAAPCGFLTPTLPTATPADTDPRISSIPSPAAEQIRRLQPPHCPHRAWIQSAFVSLPFVGLCRGGGCRTHTRNGVPRRGTVGAR
jgi:hypothetical protein